MKYIFAFALILICGSCTKNSRSGAPASQPDQPQSDKITERALSGKVRGEPFTVGRTIARVHDFGPKGKRLVLTFANGNDVDSLSCRVATPLLYATAASPLEVGSFDATFKTDPATGNVQLSAAYITFESRDADATNAIIAEKGTVRIDSISPTQIEGGIVAISETNSGNYLNGLFIAEVCN